MVRVGRGGPFGSVKRGASAAGLSEPSDHYGGGGRGRRPDRRVHPHHGRTHEPDPRADRYSGERWRRRRDAGRPARRQGRAGRLHGAARHHRDPHQPAALWRQAALRPAQRLRPGGADRRDSADPDRAQGLPGQHLRGVRRPRQGEPGQAQLRLGGRRLCRASGLRHARSGARHRHPARAVSRHRAGNAGHARRPASIFSAKSP